jgi:hypothetical protein
MPNLAEWRLTDTGWLQVFVDNERAGRSFFNLAAFPTLTITLRASELGDSRQAQSKMPPKASGSQRSRILMATRST